MKAKFKKLKEQAFETTDWDQLEYDVVMEKYGELIVRECSRMCGSQADQRNILSHFGLPVESNINYPSPEKTSSVQSQYKREYNILRNTDE